ncbi:MAG: polysaccharide biosynthesis protein [Firmicutes bacterium]|nr:polysaccharide biosynthesis protein [Bacillota bacterium]
MSQRTSRDAYLQGAFILAAASMVSRILGAFYRIPFGRIVGAEVLGLYQVGYSYYIVLVGLATSGLNVAVSKLMADRLAAGDEAAAHRVFRAVLLLLALAGLGSAALLVLLAGPLVTLSRMPDAYLAVVALAPALVLVSLEAAFRGYFQGYQRMGAPAASQVVEQVFRVAAILVLGLALLPRGKAWAAAGATFGAAIGATAGLAFLLVPYFRARRVAGGLIPGAQGPASAGESLPVIARSIVMVALPVSLAAVALPVMNLVDTLTVPYRLAGAGVPAAELSRQFAWLTGMAMTVVNLPAVVTAGLQTSLVPAVAEGWTLGEATGVRHKASTALRLTLLVALPAFAGLWALATPICDLLFGEPQAGVALAALSGATVFLMVQQTTSGILQGLGRSDIPALNLLVGAAVKAVLVWVLVGTSLGIRGAALSSVGGFLVAAFSNTLAVRRLVGLDLDLARTLVKPAVASAVMGLAVRAGYDWLAPSLGSSWATALLVLAGPVVYGLALLGLRGLRESDFSYVPAVGLPVARLLRRAGLLRD